MLKYGAMFWKMYYMLLECGCYLQVIWKVPILKILENQLGNVNVSVCFYESCKLQTCDLP